MDEREVIVIGDPHGTRKEFNQLLEKFKYNKNKHRIILCGDAIDRGEDPIGLLHQIQDMNLEMTLANHEEKALRWRKHEAFKEATCTPNPMKEPVASRRKEWEALTKADLKWIASLPVSIRIKENWVVVHAGLVPSLSLQNQNPEHVIRVRYVDEKTLEYKAAKNKEQPKGSIFWAEAWNQPMNVVFGHTRFKEPKIFKNKNNVCVGIDTGCVYGGELTAYNINKNEFTSVKAERKYYP